MESDKELRKCLSDIEFEKATLEDGFWVKSFQSPYLIDSEVVEFNSIQDFYDLLCDLDKNPYYAIMRATPVKAISQQVRRISMDKVEDGITTKATFLDDKINWVCIDLDKCELPEGITEEEVPEFCIEYKFPEYFKDVSYIAQFSNRAGISGWGVAKLHFWFLLDNGRTNEEMKRWQSHNKQFDASVYKTVQPIYTSAPLFINGLSDFTPVKHRVKMFIKSKDTVSIQIPAERAVEVFENPNSEDGDYDDEKFLRFIDQITSAGAHESTKSAATSYYTKFGVNCDWNYFKGLVLARMCAVGHPRANMNTVNAEVDELIVWTRQNCTPLNHLPKQEWLKQQGKLVVELDDNILNELKLKRKKK